MGAIAGVGWLQSWRRTPSRSSTSSIVLEVHLLRHAWRPWVTSFVSTHTVVILLTGRDGLGALCHATLSVRTGIVVGRDA